MITWCRDFAWRPLETRSERAGVAAPHTNPTSGMLGATRRARQRPDLQTRSRGQRDTRALPTGVGTGNGL